MPASGHIAGGNAAANLLNASLDAYWRSCPLAGLPSARAARLLAAYMAFVAVAGAVLPGRTVVGSLLADGTRLSYRCNGLAVTLAAVAACLGMWWHDPSWLTSVADVAGELFATAFAGSFVLSVVLYVKGLTSSARSASLKPQLTSNVVMDWWLGTQLNPTAVGGFLDLKWFCLRLGMLGWLVLNIIIAAKQLQQQQQQKSSPDGSFFGITLPLPMILYQAFTGLYVLDFFWYEEKMTSTWDIIAENFGFMLAFGDLVWIPFVFSLQAWWLLTHSHDVSASIPTSFTPMWTVVLCALFLVGYMIFRGANSQKHEFKKDRTTRIWGHPPRIVGGKLLASGYWGLARHCNYLGDLLLAVSFSLPCGFLSPLPYVYPTYLLILLVQREWRDETRCRAKYKEVWEEYCRIVPWRILPWVY